MSELVLPLAPVLRGEVLFARSAPALRVRVLHLLLAVQAVLLTVGLQEKFI
jgi:hypothetical protein